MTKTSKFVLMVIASLAGAASLSQAYAQWWTAAPADFEECAERAERTPGGPDAHTRALISCESRFAGRRKPGGGYSYYDFLQDKTFDIAGPNPTVAEQKAIDEEYKVYLDKNRRTVVLAAYAEKQPEMDIAPAPDIVPAPEAALPEVKTVAVPLPRPRPRIKGPDCNSEPLACGWAKLSTGIKDIKDSLFGQQQPAPKNKRTAQAKPQA
ncbi:MAG: hypothetical protein ABWY18_18675 [Tardiphaga sp.]